MIYLLFALALQSQTTIGPVDLYQPLFPRNFAKGDDGTFYILDPEEHQVRHYSTQITRLKTFGGKGEGPGEFSFSSSINYLDGAVYVEDTGFFTLFHDDGKPREKIRKPFDADWFPTGKSWIALKRSKSMQYIELIWLSRDFKQQRILATDLDTSFEGTSFNPEGRPIPPAFSKMRNRMAIADKQRFSIKVFDTHTGTLLHTIKEKVERIPYDREWGEISAKRMLAMLTAYNALDSTPSSFNFPNYFPPIQKLEYTVDDHLIAYGLLRPGRIKPDFAFDLSGKRVPIKGGPEDKIFRVLMQYNGFAYVNIFKNEEVFIQKAQLSELPAILAASKNR
ncbi:hypothetical protein [Acanthopleuribacter pedis]|uniref:Uncharacterized protein n=1 Tax=Acanthopleuribacter pedis TaxID=442870 RepID=A0A8J7QEK7_9BACT|nr:hypothetical protein [Acanthopleuribacter pedis]MBO1322504.1 hypothetical protein [Acanthopleuribacter pedis]